MKTRTAWSRALFVLLACATVALAQDASDDDMSSMGSSSTDTPSADIPSTDIPNGDARDLLGDRAREPDGTPDPSAGDTITQTDNAGVATMTIPSQDTSTSTVTRSTSKSTSFSVGVGVPIGDPNSPAMYLFPSLSTQHHSHSGPSSEIPAGPIWSNGDAQLKCPAVCGQSNLTWTGDWRTVEENVQSVCSCAAGVYGTSAGGRGGSCSAPPNYQCRGCSVSCPPGQAARCTQGDRGIFTESQSAICQTEAKCECQ